MVLFSYGACVRLFQLAGRYWTEIDGACAWAGFDPLDYGLTRFLNLILSWARDHTHPDQWESVEAEIFSPLLRPGQDADSVDPSVAAEEMALFAAFASQSKVLGG